MNYFSKLLKSFKPVSKLSISCVLRLGKTSFILAYLPSTRAASIIELKLLSKSKPISFINVETEVEVKIFSSPLQDVSWKKDRMKSTIEVLAIKIRKKERITMKNLMHRFHLKHLCFFTYKTRMTMIKVSPTKRASKTARVT